MRNDFAWTPLGRAWTDGISENFGRAVFKGGRGAAAHKKTHHTSPPSALMPMPLTRYSRTPSTVGR